MFLVTVVLLSFLLVSGVWAQSEMAQCHPGYEWNRNYLGQDPCTVGSMLDASCRGLVTYNYPPVNASESYRPPRVRTDDLSCDCNTVMYNLYSACVTCQGGWIYSLPEWLPFCEVVYISQYPDSIPQGTAIPRWAFFNVTASVNQTYDQATMISIGRDPEEMPPSVSTSLISSLTAPPGPTSDSSSDTEGGTHVRAIVGGVVGSVALLTILAVVAFLYARYRRKQQVQSQMLNQDRLDPYEQRPLMYGPPITSVPFTPDNPSDPLTLPPQNPSDPSTFPPQNPSDSTFLQSSFDPPTPPPQNPSGPRRSLWVHKLKW